VAEAAGKTIDININLLNTFYHGKITF
jgi:hypothetical protein